MSTTRKKVSQNGGGEPKARQVEFRVDQERMGELVTVDELIGLEEGNTRAIRDVLGKFVWDGQGYLPDEEGMAVIGKMTLNQLNDTAREFMGKLKNAAVPLAKDRG